jgi:transcriptional regulator with PAS, ATPase and Fis domain
MVFRSWLESDIEQVAFLRRVLDQVSECLVAVNTDGLIVYINGPYCRLLGGEMDDFLGRHITDVVSKKSLLHLVARGHPAQMALPLEVKGHQLLTRQVPLVQDGQIIGAVGMALFSDIATLKEAYQQASRAGVSLPKHKSGWIASYTTQDIIGAGAKMDRMREQICQASSNRLSVLLQGETGTGKELVASAIHTASERANGPFVWVNCASISESLVEADLFGYEGGSFTGAKSQGRPGKFELASGGTLFLDEIGDMPLHLQASLLRAIQSGVINRVGGTVPITVDTRIICATHQPLLKLVREGRFRQDLYYRLNVLTIELPPLRERDDLIEFAAKLLVKLAAQEKLVERALSDDQKMSLRAYQWPGNVRELQSVLIRFLLSCELELDPAMHQSINEIQDFNLDARLHSARRTAIADALARSGNNKEEAASLLGISRATLYRELSEK